MSSPKFRDPEFIRLWKLLQLSFDKLEEEMRRWAANDVVAASKRCGEAAKTLPPMRTSYAKQLQQSIDYWSTEAMRLRRAIWLFC
ncbi:unnamed protein product [Linum trigynum]|uniref:Uncharacterized protein n=1 Tax=Linum trigynum TaxID=586398 RepID=A0AAV2EAM0_9ROSI